MDYENYETEAAVVADLVDRQPRVQKIGRRWFSLLPGEHPKPLVELEGPPRRVAQSLDVLDLDDFRRFLVEHLNGTEEAGPDEYGIPVIFASPPGKTGVGSLECVLDYHADRCVPAWGLNRVGWDLRYDARYTAWSEHFNEWIAQTTLIDLIEQNEAAMLKPSSAEMLALAENLEIHRSAKVISRKSLRNGTGEVRFETSEGEASTKLPERIEVVVPIYRGLYGDTGKPKAWPVSLRLRYRVENGSVQFQLVPVGLEDLLDEIWRDLVKEVAGWGVAPTYSAEAPGYSPANDIG